MNPFTYCNPVKVVFGAGRLAEAGAEAAKLGRRAFVVSYSDNSVKGTLARLGELFDAAGVAHEEFLEVVPNPPIEMVARTSSSASAAEARWTPRRRSPRASCTNTATSGTWSTHATPT